MTFTLAIVMVAAIGTIAVALVVIHLLQRLHDLEQAVQGGLTAPSRRLTREEFERRFATARQRALLGERIGTGVLIVVDHGSPASDAIVRTIKHLPSAELVFVHHANGALATGSNDFPRGLSIIDNLDQPTESLGIASLPFAFVIDDAIVTGARPLAGPDDLLDLLRSHT